MFGRPLGAILGPSWGQDGPKMAPRWPPRGPKMGSGWAQKSSNSLGKINIFAVGGQLDPKIAQDGTKLAPTGPKMAQDGPKRADTDQGEVR